MTAYQAARTNMVDSQIHTMGVVSENVLDAYRTVPREKFVPENRQGIAYNDEDMPIGGGRSLMEPVTHARLMQAAAPTDQDVVLDIGGATGYSAAILSSLVSRIVAADDNDACLAQAKKLWAGLGCANVVSHKAPFGEGCAGHGPYSLIFVNGTISDIPQAWIAQLAPKGRLLCVVKTINDNMGKAILLQKGDGDSLSERTLFDAAVPYLPGFEPRAGFVF